MAHGQGGAEVMKDKSPSLSCNHEAPILLDDQGGGVMSVSQNNKAGTLRSEAHGNVPIVYENHAQDSRVKEVSVAPQLNTNAGGGGGNLPLVQAFTQNQMGDILTGSVCPSMGTNQNASGRNTPKVQSDSSVRRLTPVECSRLQGFPDTHTKIPAKILKSKPRTKHFAKYPDLYKDNLDGTWTKYYGDGPQYKALGNSWAVPCAAWIVRRIQQFEDSQFILPMEDFENGTK